jgi:dTDP-4-dehydrorhamnose 3,5-epimerase
MRVKETYLEGCFVIEPNVFDDRRGSFFESFNKKVFEQCTGLRIDFVQDNQSISQRGALRGLHLQRGVFSQAKLVRVIKGKILDIVVDVRKDSETFGKVFSIELSGENNKQLFIPKGFLHGFSVLEDNTFFSYKCDNYYHKESEDGVLFNDKDLNIDWSLKNDEIVLSEKDKELKTFKEFSKNVENDNKTVLTYGTFDLLHYGHIEILKRASKLGKRLIVGLSTDEFNLIKGKECKIPYKKRKELLESIAFVDEVIPESNWDQKPLDIKKHNADVFVMGDDWKGEFDTLKEFCEVVYLPRTIDISTSILKKVMNNKH